VDDLKAANTRTQGEIDAIKSRVADHQKILDELAEIRRREEAIEQLQAARTGPMSMLVEISKILTPAARRRPTRRRSSWLRTHDRLAPLEQRLGAAAALAEQLRGGEPQREDLGRGPHERRRERVHDPPAAEPLLPERAARPHGGDDQRARRRSRCRSSPSRAG
jgi:hypothetical protein